MMVRKKLAKKRSENLFNFVESESSEEEENSRKKNSNEPNVVCTLRFKGRPKSPH
jgi:hypothetical protein